MDCEGPSSPAGCVFPPRGLPYTAAESHRAAACLSSQCTSTPYNLHILLIETKAQATTAVLRTSVSIRPLDPAVAKRPNPLPEGEPRRQAVFFASFVEAVISRCPFAPKSEGAGVFCSAKAVAVIELVGPYARTACKRFRVRHYCPRPPQCLTFDPCLVP